MTTSGRFAAAVAVHLLLTRGETVLLLRRANTGYEDGNYSVPAGHLDGGETVTIGGIREAEEEVGVRLTPTDLSFAVVMHRRAELERIDFSLVATTWEGEPYNREPEKCDELRWAPFGSLPENTVPYVRRGVQAYLAGTRFVEFGWD